MELLIITITMTLLMGFVGYQIGKYESVSLTFNEDFYKNLEDRLRKNVWEEFKKD